MEKGFTLEIEPKNHLFKIIEDNYGFRPEVIKKYNGHTRNAIYLVFSSNKKYLFKVFIKPLRDNQLLIESYIADKTKNKNIKIPAYIKSSKGLEYSYIGSKRAVLYEYISHEEFENNSENIQKVASALATIHKSLSGAKNDLKDSLYLAKYPFGDNLFNFFRKRKIEMQLKKIKDYFGQKTENPKLIETIIQGDCLDMGHISINGNQVFFYDYEKCNYSFRITELARTAYNFGYRNNNEAFSLKKIIYFINAYNSQYPLLNDEIELLGYFIIIAFMEDYRIMLLGHDKFSADRILNHYQNYFLFIDRLSQFDLILSKLFN